MALRSFPLVITLAAGLVSMVLPAAIGQTPATPQTYVPQQTPDGQPNFQGLWAPRTEGMPTYSLEERDNNQHLVLSAGCAQDVVRCERSAAEIDAQVAERTREPVSIIVDPPDGKVPYQPWAAAKKRDVVENHTNPQTQHLDPMARCFLAGVPRATYQEYEALQIIQLPNYVVISYEFLHAYRIIPLDGRSRLDDNIKLWMGDSRGRWEGNTLVVDVTNLNDRTWFDIVGTFHSDALHVVERWTLVDADTIQYEATIEDPKVFTRPWKIAFPLARKKERGYELVEMACREGERSVERMLRK